MAVWPMVVDFLIVLSCICTLQAFRDYRRRRGLPYPPGPRPLPIIGNLLDIPMESSWLAYSQLAKKYGTSLRSLHVSRRHPQCFQGMSCLFTFSGVSSSYWALPRLPKICWENVGMSTLIAL